MRRIEVKKTELEVHKWNKWTASWLSYRKKDDLRLYESIPIHIFVDIYNENEWKQVVMNLPLGKQLHQFLTQLIMYKTAQCF